MLLFVEHLFIFLFMATREISKEEISKFMEGHDPEERIVNILSNYQDDFVTIVYRDKQDRKCIRRQSFYPFCWATLKACQKLCGGDRDELKKLMARHNIKVKKLSNISIDGEVRHEFDNGYMFMFYAASPMSYSAFLQFFKYAKNPIYSKKNDDRIPADEKRQYLIVSPQEQFMISTGKRFFKGFDDYDDLLKMTFDLETTGLNVDTDRIIQIGIRFNRPFPGHPNGFEKILTVVGETEEDKDACEMMCIDEMLKIIYTFKPDIITAHNGENFDWNMIIGACKRLGTSLEEMSSPYFDGEPIHKDEKETVLKLGGEIETFYRTQVPGIIITDSLHAVRRAQAIDSNFLKADLKYSTEYLGMKKLNRVYVPGKMISETWKDNEEHYAFNDNNGDWYRYDPQSENSSQTIEKIGEKKDFIPVRNLILDGYVLKSGKYIVERYLGDDLWECDKVEYKLNTTNFLICKLLPVTYSKATTMGTAGQWKMLMLAWSYENGLAVPMGENTGSFTGGLSRLLKVGYAPNVAKFDYNSLYPSIILTWGIHDKTDLLNSMLKFLEYVLTEREKYKKLKKAAGKKVDAFEERINKGEKLSNEELEAYHKAQGDYSYNDKKQSQMKVFGNSFFGSYGSLSGAVFPWKSQKCAEQTTCTGRMALRLMISHFSNLGYAPIVGDSFTEDTPLFIKYHESGLIDIKTIGELIEVDKINIDALGREYDYSKKDYDVLCRSGWVEPSYIYRHKTNKDIYRVQDGKTEVDITEDHSLFDKHQEEIKPSEITENTSLEYYKKEINGEKILYEYDDIDVDKTVSDIMSKKIDGIPVSILNGSRALKEAFIYSFLRHSNEFACYCYKNNIKSSDYFSKKTRAGLQYLSKIVGKAV